MMNRTLLHVFGSLLLLTAGVISSSAQSKIGLKFERTGTDAASVSTLVLDENGVVIKGASATVTSSHAFKATGSSVTTGILCPDVNGNADPTIVLKVAVSGLPAGITFNEIGLNIHALNGSGGYQQNNDNKVRQFNVAVKQGSSADALQPFGTLSDIDIAAGVGEGGLVQKMWSVTTDNAATTSSKLVLQLTITKGATNDGCFFGLSHITLGSTDIIEPSEEPDTENNLAGIYNIVWKSNTSSYMSEEADGSMVVSGYDVSRRCFWELIPAEQEGCYYVRNTATGRYIESCNKTPSSASTIKTTDTPIAYYFGKTAGTAAEIAGCYWLSSTDCTDYSDETAGPRALNKDGASSNIITWQAGTSRVGSYWRLVKTENLYEVKPFLPSAEINNPQYRYTVLSTDSKALEMATDGTLSWQTPAGTPEQEWYFVGDSNAGGGYLFVNAGSNKTINVADEETRWCVFEAQTNGYVFRPFADKSNEEANLTIEGVSQFHFSLLRSNFARAAQIYELPCGTLSTHYLTKASITGEGAAVPMTYPLPTQSGSNLTQPAAAKPSNWYTIYTQDKANVCIGKTFEVRLELNSAPADGQTAFLYFDWNRDGIFETSLPLTIEQTMTVSVDVPADATIGKSRMRFRLTENGMEGSEDEVIGQTVDFVLNITEANDEEFPVSVKSNDNSRGTATLSDDLTTTSGTAVATPLGNASFICWREGKKIVSVDANYTFERNHIIDLTAYFSPNTIEVPVGIESAENASQNILVEISAENKTIQVKTEAHVKRLQLFSSDGALLASTAGKSLRTSGLTHGMYIVKVVTDKKDTTAKVIVK